MDGWQTQTKHERDRPQMADDDANDSQALTGGDITLYRELVARFSFLSLDRPALKFASVQVCCASGKAIGSVTWSASRGSGDTLAGKPRAKCWFRWQQQSGELEAYLRR